MTAARSSYKRLGESELKDAIESDRLRKVQDEAKKRAMSQLCDYDTFKNMVSVAHLDPINAPKTQASAAPAPAKTFAADGTLVPTRGDATAAVPAAALSADQLSAPRTVQEFARDWRRHCSTVTQRVSYLRLCAGSPGGLAGVFKVEVSAQHIADIAGALLDAARAGGNGDDDGAAAGEDFPAFALACLQGLTQAGRFSLSCKLVPRAGKEVVDELLRWLGGSGVEQAEVRKVAQAFGSKAIES
ncbi:unnamed protein product [Pedinophyceae sp. YPF-701]|nr:unnamed protein product [Pedinophyceae sp. YPF-701]